MKPFNSVAAVLPCIPALLLSVAVRSAPLGARRLRTLPAHTTGSRETARRRGEFVFGEDRELESMLLESTLSMSLSMPPVEVAAPEAEAADPEVEAEARSGAASVGATAAALIATTAGAAVLL